MFCILVSRITKVELVSKERAFPVRCRTKQTKLEGSNFRIGENRTLLNWQKLGSFPIGKNRTSPIWQSWDSSGLALPDWHFRIGTLPVGTLPGHYPLARILRLHYGKDGCARSADIKTVTSELTRPTVTLAPVLPSLGVEDVIAQM